MWKCNRCGEVFEDPASREYCCEDYAGVGSMFPDRHYSSYDVCPHCGSARIEEVWEDEDGIEE
jgi:predicted  nucleic acid-binding Zn-ribbon protein